jgi:hypothetical protein
MYHFITDKEYLKKLKSCCSDIINQLVQFINEDGVMEVQAHLVGSGARNLITQNEQEPVDLDYNLEILDSGEFNINDGRGIEEYVRKAFNKVLNRNGWGDCHDSTSAFTTEQRVFNEGNKTPFSIDLCIIRCDQIGWYRLIHKKTGWVDLDQYYWNQAPNSHGLQNRVDWLKEQSLWIEVREAYLKKKNWYLRYQNYDHSSFNCFIEAVNEVYNKY